MKVLGNQLYRFEDVEVDTSQGCLRRGGETVYLRQKAFQVLVYLLEQRHRSISKEELLETIWDDAAVTDDSLVQCVREIRRALGDDPRNPRYIKTLSKIGYRFIGSVNELYLNAPENLMMEEVTSFELEYEEEIADEERLKVDTARTIPTPKVRQRVRLVVMAGLAIASIGVIAAIYLAQSRRGSGAPEVSIPQVPGKKPVAVMFFENRSATAELDWLREGLADMLITGLSRSKKLTVLSRQQLHSLYERTGRRLGQRVPLDESINIAHRSRAELLVLGSFAKLGETIRIEAQLHDATTGQLIAAESLMADKPEQLLRQVDLLSLKLAVHLGSPEEGQSDKLDQVMTDNLEAYRCYSLGVEKAQALQTPEALRLLEKAVTLDPKFAMAHARIGYAYAVTWGPPEKAKPHLEKAFQLSARLTEKDRLYINAWYSIANIDFSAAIRSFQDIIAQYPMEIEAYERLGRLLLGENRFEEAVEVLNQALVLDAEAKNVYNALGLVFMQMGKLDEGIASHQRYVQLAPAEPNVYDSLGLSYQRAGRYREAVEEYNRALAINPDFEIATIHLGNAYVQQGSYRKAIQEFYKYIALAPSDHERARGYSVVSWVYLKKGELELAQRANDRCLKYEWARPISLALALARGNTQTVEKLKDKLFSDEHFLNRGMRYEVRSLYYLRGCVALKEGRQADALDHFKKALQHYGPYYHLDTFEDCLANAYRELGRFDEAIAEYERILTINPNYPLAHYHLALAYERKGEIDRARTYYSQFLQVWSAADADIPQVIDAKKRLLILGQ